MQNQRRLTTRYQLEALGKGYGSQAEGEEYMTDLRKAAEAVLEAWSWDWSEPRNKALRERMKALRQALSDSEWIGLKDDDFNVKQVGEFDVVKFARYIEAILKEKNT